MANMYNQPKQAQFMQTYMSQYVPLPFEEMQKTLALKQGQYDATEQYYQNAATDFAGIQGIAGRDSQYLAEKNGQLQEFISTIEGKDLTDPEILKSIRSTVRSVANDPALKRIQENRAKVLEYQENLKKAVSEGTERPENVYFFEKELKRYQQTGFEGGDLPDPTIPKGLDEFSKFTKYYDMLDPEERDNIASISYDNSEGGGKAYYTSTTKGVSSKRVSDQTMNILEDAKNSPEGRQAMRRYYMEQELQGKQGTESGAINYLAQQLWSAGKGYIHESTTSDKAAALNRKDEKEATYMAGITQMFTPEAIEGSTGLKYNAEGNIDGKDGMSMGNIAKAVYAGGLEGITSGRTLALVAGIIKGSSEIERKQAAEQSIKILAASQVNGTNHKSIVDQSMKTQSLDVKHYVKASDRDNSSKVLFDGGVGTWISSTFITKDGKRIPAKQAVTQALDLDHDASVAEITEALGANGGVGVLGELVPGNPFAAKGAHISLNGESYIMDTSHLYRPKTEAQYKQWAIDQESHHQAKVKTQMVVEDEDYDKNGNVIKVYDIWNFKKNTYDTYTEKQYQELINKQLEKYK